MLFPCVSHLGPLRLRFLFCHYVIVPRVSSSSELSRYSPDCLSSEFSCFSLSFLSLCSVEFYSCLSPLSSFRQAFLYFTQILLLGCSADPSAFACWLCLSDSLPFLPFRDTLLMLLFFSFWTYFPYGLRDPISKAVSGVRFSVFLPHSSDVFISYLLVVFSRFASFSVFDRYSLDVLLSCILIIGSLILHSFHILLILSTFCTLSPGGLGQLAQSLHIKVLPGAGNADRRERGPGPE